MMTRAELYDLPKMTPMEYIAMMNKLLAAALDRRLDLTERQRTLLMEIGAQFERFGRRNGNDYVIWLSQREMAERLGVVPSTVSEAMAAYTAAGILRAVPYATGTTGRKRNYTAIAA